MNDPSQTPTPSWTLGVFAKQPRPGHVKSRLAADTSSAFAAEVAHAFLRDTLTRLATVNVRRVLVFSPPEAESYFADLVNGCFSPVPQCDGDLGLRMATFIADELRSGSERVVLVGTDSPTLPPAFVEQAFRELAQADVVLGPAADGGFYLLGCAGRLPPIFEGIGWGGDRVLFDTVVRLAAPSWRLAVLPPWYDVDTLEDWWALRGHLAALRRSGIDPQTPCTEAVVDYA